jgi:hypothetical protein
VIPTTRLRVAGAAALAATAVLVPLLAHASPAAAVAPAEVVSPLPGTPDANPHTQLSFLGAPASELSAVVVRGTLSGLHGGVLRAYSTGTGASFLPTSPFDSGEQVTVTATLTPPGAPAQKIGTTFTVSSPYTLPPPGPSKPVKVTATNVQRFRSAPDLRPPAVTVTTPAANPALGDILLSPDSGPGQNGPMIVAPSGQLVWFAPVRNGQAAFDLQVQSYRGRPALTWWQGEIIGGHGQGADVIDNTRYQRLATVHAGNGLDADLHEFSITPQGTAWITAYAPQHWDLRTDGGLRAGLIDDSVVQEIDIATGLVMFEWHALGHVDIAASYKHAPRANGDVLDFFHVNSIDPLPDGDLLISSRNMWAVYLISGTTGAVEWQLGGRSSTFTLGAGVRFAWQHDATMLPNGTITLFDNEAGPEEATQSRAVDIAIDQTGHTASLVNQITYPGQGIIAESQGNIQELSNGDAFVDWGQAGEISEFSPGDTLTFDMHLSTPANSYRAFREAWQAQPATRPAVVVRAAGGRTELWASWNGATNVTAWRVLAGNSQHRLEVVGTYPASGFETAISAPTAKRLVRVQALGIGRVLLRNSPLISARPR